MNSGTTPTDLLASSKQKFILSQARLRRGLVELTLLSLQGSLQDGLRSYLLLHGHPSARADFAALREALASAASLRLEEEEASRIQHMEQVRSRISEGEAVTLAYESLADYQQFVARLLLRYGVLVVVPDQERTGSQPFASAAFSHVSAPPRLHSTSPLSRVAAALLVLLLLAVLAATIIISRPAAAWNFWQLPAPSISSPGTVQPAASPAPTRLPPDALAPGRTAYVRTGNSSDLALRAQPGSASDNPIRLYLSADTVVQVIEGPVQTEGTDWWKVRVANQEGWCAGTFLAAR